VAAAGGEALREQQPEVVAFVSKMVAVRHTDLPEQKRHADSLTAQQAQEKYESFSSSHQCDLYISLQRGHAELTHPALMTHGLPHPSWTSRREALLAQRRLEGRDKALDGTQLMFIPDHQEVNAPLDPSGSVMMPKTDSSEGAESELSETVLNEEKEGEEKAEGSGLVLVAYTRKIGSCDSALFPPHTPHTHIHHTHTHTHPGPFLYPPPGTCALRWQSPLPSCPCWISALHAVLALQASSAVLCGGAKRSTSWGPGMIRAGPLARSGRRSNAVRRR